jgi:uncharacterized iron-regulated membrane protein
MRRLVLRFHLILASIAGVFLLILGVTGSIMAFEPELWHLLHRQLSYVAPSGTVLPLATLGEAAMRAAPGGQIGGYGLSVSPDLSYQVMLRGRVAYVNQYTGEVLGIIPNGPDVLSRVHQLHLRLLWRDERDRGKTIMSWSGVALVVLLASGLYLWWPLKRLRVRRDGSTRQAWFDLHSVIGIVSLVFLLLLAVTGIFIGFDDKAVPLAYRLTGTQPALVYGQAPPLHSVADGRRMITPDDAVAAARRALPGATPISVNVPSPSGVYAISARYPEDLTPGGRSRVLIDPYSGDVLAAEGSRAAPAGTRLVTLNRAIHTGDIFGLASKAIMSLASLAVVGQALSGLVIWWTRRPR